MQLSLYESILMFLFICIATIISIYFFVSIKDNNTKESFMTQQCIDEERALENCKSTYQIQSSNKTEVPSNPKDIENQIMDKRQENINYILTEHKLRLNEYEIMGHIYEEKLSQIDQHYGIIKSHINKYNSNVILNTINIEDPSNFTDLSNFEKHLLESLENIEEHNSNIKYNLNKILHIVGE